MAQKRKASSKPVKRRSVATVSSSATRTFRQFELDDDIPPASKSAFGRCGGRLITNRIEQTTCDLLQTAGIAHIHSPRYFEVRLDETRVGAYSPEIVLRGRGREGKLVIIESATGEKDDALPKIVAFRDQYGSDYYLIMVAREEVLEKVSIKAYDESTTTVDLKTFISRMTD